MRKINFCYILDAYPVAGCDTAPQTSPSLFFVVSFFSQYFHVEGIQKPVQVLNSLQR
jgi:hypothetical protein